MYVMGLMVNAQTEQKPASVAFAHYVTDATRQMQFAKKVAIFPSTAGSLDEPYFTEEDGTDETRVRIAAAKSLKTARQLHPGAVQRTDEDRAPQPDRQGAPGEAESQGGS